jgi:hypothetical protein
VSAYRIYYLGAAGRLQLGETLHCASDAEAIQQALEISGDGRAGELWDGGRLVGRFSKLGVFTPE